MAGLSLREAATAAGTSKSTILRAIQGGRLSANRLDDGGYSIDPAELFRVYEPKQSGNGAQRSLGGAVGHDTTVQSGPGTDATAELRVDTELRIANARLEAELSALKSILDIERRRAEDLQTDRDRWAAQAERLALVAPSKHSHAVQPTFWKRLMQRGA